MHADITNANDDNVVTGMHGREKNIWLSLLYFRFMKTESIKSGGGEVNFYVLCQPRQDADDSIPYAHP